MYKFMLDKGILSSLNARSPGNRLVGDNALAKFNSYSAIGRPGLLSWCPTKGLLKQIVDQEVEMYQWHQRDVDGWHDSALHHMVFSLT